MNKEQFINELKKQVFEVVGTEIPFFEVSVKKYQQGLYKSKDILIKNSGILELKEYLENYAKKYLEKKITIDEKEYVLIIKEVKEILKIVHYDKVKQKGKIINAVKSNQKSRKSAWNQVYDYFFAQRNKLSNLQDEIKNI